MRDRYGRWGEIVRVSASVPERRGIVLSTDPGGEHAEPQREVSPSPQGRWSTGTFPDHGAPACRFFSVPGPPRALVTALAGLPATRLCGVATPAGPDPGSPSREDQARPRRRGPRERHRLQAVHRRGCFRMRSGRSARRRSRREWSVGRHPGRLDPGGCTRGHLPDSGRCGPGSRVTDNEDGTCHCEYTLLQLDVKGAVGKARLAASNVASSRRSPCSERDDGNVDGGSEICVPIQATSCLPARFASVPRPEAVGLVDGAIHVTHEVAARCRLMVGRSSFPAPGSFLLDLGPAPDGRPCAHRESSLRSRGRRAPG